LERKASGTARGFPSFWPCFFWRLRCVFLAPLFVGDPQASPVVRSACPSIRQSLSPLIPNFLVTKLLVTKLLVTSFSAATFFGRQNPI
jgi:hypothetical protein